MYEQFFELREKPFNMTPDPEFLFFTEKHKEAFAHLVYGIRERRGFIEITGEVGAGKTTICRALLNEFDADTKIALILNPFLSDMELLRSINEELYIDATGETKKQLLDTLNRYLIDQHAAGHNVVLVIDEAQNLPIETLEQIRIISNLETVKAKLIQIVLVGQPELREVLSRSELRQLNQRITVRYHISPLSRQEMEEYIFHRLRVAGDEEGRIEFTPAALELLYKYSGGIPRMINILCDHALLSGYVFEQYQIDEEIVKKAHHEIAGQGVKLPMAGGRRRLLTPIVAVTAVVSLLAGIGFAAAVGWLNLGSLFGGQPASVQVSLEEETAPVMIPAEESEAAVEAPVVEPSLTPTPAVEKIILTQEKTPEPAPAAEEVQAPTIEISVVQAQEVISVTPTEVAQIAEVIKKATTVVVDVTPEPRAADVFAAAVSQMEEQDLGSRDEQKVKPEGSFLAPEQPVAPGKFDTEGVLRCRAPGETLTAALLNLAHQWIPDQAMLESYFEQHRDETEAKWFEKAFEPYRLSLISWSTNLTMVESINLPAVAEVYEEQLFTPTYVTIVGFDGEQLTIANPREGLEKLSTAEFYPMWFGRLLTAVPKSVEPRTVLGLNSSGEEVLMLQARLRRLGFYDREPSGRFDPYTRNQVRLFQRRHRIKIDGLVGLETNLVLFSQLAGQDAPRLAAHDQQAQEAQAAPRGNSQ